MRILAIAVACLALAACTTTNVRKVSVAQLATPAPNAKGILLQPDVQLSLLTAAGLQEPRQDWSKDSQSNLALAIQRQLESRQHAFRLLDPQKSMEGQEGQLLRLHEAVGQSIMVFEYTPTKLPTKKGDFDWTLGDGTTALRDSYQVDYAMFVTARGSYASAGRKVVMVGAAMLGVGVPMGSQQVFASLVDLRSGQVIWFNVASAGPTADMRSEEGARALVKDLLKSAPL